MNIDSTRILALSGPSIAKEIAEGKPSYIILGGDRQYTQIVKESFETEKFMIRSTRDKTGIQYLGFYKNILAILAGISDGLDLGNNYKSALITKAYSEFYYLNQNKNIRRHSFIDYAGLGDLYVTSISETSRNYRFGQMIANNYSQKSVVHKIGQVVEGYSAIKILQKLDAVKRSEWFDRNLIQLFDRLFNAKTKVQKTNLLTRYLKSSHIKAIVFDWGNVLTKDYYITAIAKKLSRKYHADQEMIEEILEKHETQLLKGKETFSQFAKKIKTFLPYIKSKELQEIYKKTIHWDEQMIKYAKKLKQDYNIYLLSNNYDIITPLIKKKLKFFDGLLLSNEIGSSKPGDRIFQKLLKTYNLRPENCIFVDDLQINISAAERNKFNTVKFTSLPTLKTDLKKIFF